MYFLPIDEFIDTREGFIYWMFSIHNMVNRKLRHPIFELTQVLHIYMNIASQCTKNRTNIKNIEQIINQNYFQRMQAYEQKLLYVLNEFNWDFDHLYYSIFGNDEC